MCLSLGEHKNILDQAKLYLNPVFSLAISTWVFLGTYQLIYGIDGDNISLPVFVLMQLVFGGMASPTQANPGWAFSLQELPSWIGKQGKDSG